MEDERDGRKAFEERLSELKQRMEAGLVARAKTLRDAAMQLLAGDETARKVLKTESHKLRGIAGSYGYEALTELAAELEKRASLSPPSHVQQLATRLAEAAEAVGRRSMSSGSSDSIRSPTQVVVEAAKQPRRSNSSMRIKAQKATLRGLGAHGGALRVLAMDDDATTLRLLNLTLKEVGGFDAVVVTSAKEALAQLKEREFDVVISDAMMPDLNGQEFVRAARKLGGLAERVPIIILSAATRDELEWHTALPGPVVWLRKPFMPSGLVQDIARVVKQHPL
jgi:CheY-like chemotaxis protein